MTVLPFPGRTTGVVDGDRRPTEPEGSPQVTGRFACPAGGEGVFTGTYRLERLVDQYGQLAAAGVFTGELTDAGGRRIGLASRRHTAAVEVAGTTGGQVLRLGPVDVNLHGFLVAVDAFTCRVRGALTVDRGRSRHQPPTARELLGLVVDRADGPEIVAGGRPG